MIVLFVVAPVPMLALTTRTLSTQLGRWTLWLFGHLLQSHSLARSPLLPLLLDLMVCKLEALLHGPIASVV